MVRRVEMQRTPAREPARADEGGAPVIAPRVLAQEGARRLSRLHERGRALAPFAAPSGPGVSDPMAPARPARVLQRMREVAEADFDKDKPRDLDYTQSRSDYAESLKRGRGLLTPEPARTPPPVPAAPKPVRAAHAGHSQHSRPLPPPPLTPAVTAETTPPPGS